jgi:hypothetical protein
MLYKIVLVIFLIMCITIVYYYNIFNIKEGVRSGRGGHGHRHGGRGRHRVGRRGGRRWYGSNIGYSYRPPPVRYYPRYAPLWSSAYWFGSICKDGCTNIGNNNWGCQFPGNGPDDCLFASDCYGCGY